MSRREEFAAGSQRFHPNVRDYPSERAGGVNGSVVGMMPTHEVARMREFDRAGKDAIPNESEQVIAGLQQDLRSGMGFTDPLLIHYDHHNQWAFLGEGNHRIEAAMREGVPEVPVRVARDSGRARGRKPLGIGVPATHKPEAEYKPGYLASALHPSMLQIGESHEAADVHTEIRRLLEPTWGQR